MRIEIAKQDDNGQWGEVVHDDPFYHYLLYSVLANVRNDHPEYGGKVIPIFKDQELRGLPDDFYDLGYPDDGTWYYATALGDRHEILNSRWGYSTTWYLGSELLNWYDHPDSEDPHAQAIRDELDFFFDAIRQLVEQHKEVRVVVGFD